MFICLFVALLCYSLPTDVQSEAIPMILGGGDVLMVLFVCNTIESLLQVLLIDQLSALAQCFRSDVIFSSVLPWV